MSPLVVRYAVVFGLLAAAAAAYVVYKETNEVPREGPRPGTAISVGGESFSVLLAQTELERQKGLGGVTDLGPHAGMLFILEKVEGGGIWMKGMLIALDILWLSNDGVVLKMERDIAPSDTRIFMHDSRTRYVLEVPAGFAAEHGIGVGTKVDIGGGLPVTL